MNHAYSIDDPMNSAKLDSAPIVINLTKLNIKLTPIQVAQRLNHLPHLLVLESSMRHKSLGRFSYVSCDPVEWFCPIEEAASGFDWLKDRTKSFSTTNDVKLPPFQGGIAGVFDYEFASAIESVPVCRESVNHQSPLSLGIYDVVIAWDHEKKQSWLISQGFPCVDAGDRRQRAIDRSEFFLQQMDKTPGKSVATPCPSTIKHEPTISSNFEKVEYLKMIERALEYIRAGDIFQVNLAQCLTHPATTGPLELFERLRERNPATFAGYLDTGDRQIISASPERLVAVRDRHVETRPIKGTRRRTQHPEVDIDVGRELLASEKDRAENVMIVDLMRNDLSRVCCNDSVRVTQYVELEKYASVLHLVSAIEGRLRDDVDATDLLRAIFPGGSITGAPKIRAMEIIAELERWPRGAYCGSLGFIGFDGTIDLNILIRTITACDGVWRIPVGGGIVADSDPESEYDETWTKAQGMLAALASSGQVDRANSSGAA